MDEERMRRETPLRDRCRTIAQIAFAIAAALALIGLSVWALGDWRLLAFGTTGIPIAPSTACVTLVLSVCALAVASRSAPSAPAVMDRAAPERLSAHAVACVASMAAGAACLAILGQSCLAPAASLESWFWSSTERVGEIPVGRMSPLTALTLLLAALALGLTPRSPVGSPLRRLAASLAASSVVLIGSAVMLSYATGWPFLHGTRTVPMALWTAMAITSLGIGSLSFLGPAAFPLSLFTAGHEAGGAPARGAMLGASVLAFVLLAVGILTVGYCYFLRQVDATRQAAEESLEAVADLKVRQVSVWHQERIADASLLRDTPWLSVAAAGLFNDTNPVIPRRRLEMFLEAFRRSYRYNRVVLVDRELQVRLASPPEKNWLGPTARAGVAKAFASGKIEISDLHTNSAAPGEVDLDILVPLPAPSRASEAHGPPIAVVKVEIGPEQFLFPEIQNWPTPSRTAETLLVRREGDEVVYLNSLRHANDAPLTRRLPIAATHVPAVQAVLGRQGVVEGADYRGAPVLAAMRQVPGTPWSLVAKIDLEEIDSPLRAQAWTTAAVALALVLATALGVGLLTRRRDARWLQRQWEFEREHRRTLESSNRALAQQQQQLRVAHAMAEQATVAKSRFLANMSHEIRTPMTAVLGYLELIGDGCAGQCAYGCSSMSEAVAVIRRNGEHLLELINDILDLSKVEAGKLELELSPCEPRELLADVVALMRVRSQAKGLRLTAEIAGSLPGIILTDPKRLRQILINLLGNAVKFTQQGEVRLRTQLVAGDGKPLLQIEVADTGIGMSDAQQAMLFEPFTQVDNSATRRFGGTGLGLAISKQLAAALGGDIRVFSEPGAGSTFTLTIDPGPLEGVLLIGGPGIAALDAASAAPIAPPVASPPTPAAGARRLAGRILLAEDGPDSQRIIGLLLRKIGAEVKIVDNGQLAVAAALAQRDAGRPFDIVLMDMQMPVLDGYEATRALRAAGYTGAIVALTAHAMSEDRRKCLAAGCDDYLTKPVQKATLVEALSRHLAPIPTAWPGSSTAPH